MLTYWARYFATLGVFFIFFHLGVMTRVIHGLDLSQQEVAYGLAAAILLSPISLQMFAIRADRAQPPHTHQIPISINLGGCIAPLGFMLYFMQGREIDLFPLMVLVGVVSAIVYPLTYIDRNRGVVVYLVGAVVGGALGGLLFGGEHYLIWAYIAAVLGTLIGGDLLHLGMLKRLYTRQPTGIFIGGAGLMDAIFLSGLLAMMVAETLKPYWIGHA